MKICMVGTGRMAFSHSRALGGLPDVQLHTAINPNIAYAEAFAREQGYARGMASLDEALAAGGFDAVVICTPNALHASQSAAALRAGKHVLCELPLALSLAETEELGRWARRNDRRAMVCHTERYEAGRIELRRRILAGEFHPLHLMTRFWMLRRGLLVTEQAHHGWVDSVLWHHGCHVVDAVMDILGPHEARNLSAQFGPDWPELGAPLDVTLQWRATSPITGDEVLVGVSLSHNAHWGAHDYHIIGLEDDLVSSAGELRNRDGVIVERPPYQTHVQLQDAEFVAAVREGRAPALDIEAALPTMRILQAAWDLRSM
jgi:2-hydroxy-4-carboxymuconate semialdehyde hemiacetal dehydrogenase